MEKIARFTPFGLARFWDVARALFTSPAPPINSTDALSARMLDDIGQTHVSELRDVATELERKCAHARL